MAIDAKKHTTLAAGEVPSRAAIAAALLSIDDIIPVANGTEANQVAAAVAAAGQVLASNPVFVSRADAQGLHRIEYSYDGLVWMPASGVLHFATEGAANTWAASNSALLALGDRCFVGSTEYVWQGSTTWKLARLSGTNRASGGAITPSTMTTAAFIDLPANAPAGAYLIHVNSITGATASGTHYQLVSVAGVEISASGSDFMNAQPANVDIHRGDSLWHSHTGGAAQILLRVQVNAAGSYLRAARLTVQYVGG